MRSVDKLSNKKDMMMKYITMTIASAALLGLSACTTTGNVERNAAIGAAGGAVAGAIIGNNVGAGDARTGAAIGAIAGGVGGAAVGVQKDKNVNEGTRLRNNATANGEELIFEESTGRYYYFDSQRGRTYYQNGQLRG